MVVGNLRCGVGMVVSVMLYSIFRNDHMRLTIFLGLGYREEQSSCHVEYHTTTFRAPIVMVGNIFDFLETGISLPRVTNQCLPKPAPPSAERSQIDTL
jgi:hypothetical protein